jgi:hypothetical protein
MKSTRSRFIWVAALVCLFATGMATFLNYYKYKSTIGDIVKSRLLVVGYTIENSIQSSLALGLSFGELGTLPAMMEREKGAEKLVTAIDVFEPSGKMLYSTNPARVGTAVPPAWTAAAKLSKDREWQVQEPGEYVAGFAIKNNFDLTVGYLAMRYSRDYVDRNVAEMGMRLLAIGAGAFAAAVALCALLLSFLLRGYEHDMKAIEDCIAGKRDASAVPVAFRDSVDELRGAVDGADAGLARVRASLGAG